MRSRGSFKKSNTLFGYNLYRSGDSAYNLASSVDQASLPGIKTIKSMRLLPSASNNFLRQH